MTIPWATATVVGGTVPQQESPYPRQVILICRDCGRSGYWYPDANEISVSSNRCPYGERLWRTGHYWEVYSWNGNAPQEAPVSYNAQTD